MYLNIGSNFQGDFAYQNRETDIQLLDLNNIERGLVRKSETFLKIIIIIEFRAYTQKLCLIIH